VENGYHDVLFSAWIGKERRDVPFFDSCQRMVHPSQCEERESRERDEKKKRERLGFKDVSERLEEPNRPIHGAARLTRRDLGEYLAYRIEAPQESDLRDGKERDQVPIFFQVSPYIPNGYVAQEDRIERDECDREHADPALKKCQNGAPYEERRVTLLSDEGLIQFREIVFLGDEESARDGDE